ncbi:MAG: amino acid permease [Terriglobia bacterium]
MEESDQKDLDAIVDRVVAAAHIERDLILPEDVAYIRQHVLKKPLGVIHIWALGVGVVITGEYFGWNFGLPVGGPLGVLIASLIVCVLYLAWVLALSELSVAMPFAGGPLAYGRRAVGKCFGFVMGWSMFLECFFATVGTALATGGYVAFLLDPNKPDPRTTTIFAIICALGFLLLQWVGTREQAAIMVWLTYAAIAALIWFWLAALPGIDLKRIFTHPLLVHGWSGVLGSVPYALWWLVIIETVALASEEAHEPQVSIPRGLVLAQITLALLVLLTWFCASAAAPYLQTGAVDYPLPLVVKGVWGTGWFSTAFSTVALVGMVVSYNGMIYATSRQSFSLGRAGYLPKALGAVHPHRRTPHISLFVWTGATIVFIVVGHFYAHATAAAILISTLAAVIWYILAMACLFILRRKEPRLCRPYKVPAYPWLPVFVAALAAFAACVYAWVNVQVLLPTALLYVGALIWYGIWSRKNVLSVAPEEVAARIAEELALRQKRAASENHTEKMASVSPMLTKQPAGPTFPVGDSITNTRRWREWLTGAIFLLGILSLGWMVLRALDILPAVLPEKVEVVIIMLIWAVLFVVVSSMGLFSTARGKAESK